MSVIQTIRNKYGKIAGGVIAVALVGFIISDARNGSFGSFFGGHDSNVMKVNGVKIDPKEYQSRLKEYETLYTMFNKGRTIDDATRAQMNEQVVQMMVYETVVGQQCDKLGIMTTDDEKKLLIYDPMMADPLVRQFQIQGQQVFINPQTRSFDPGYVKELEKELQEQPQKIDPTGKLREEWETVKAYVYRMNRINKYNSLFTGSVYAPVYIAKRSAADENAMATIKYVKVPFASVTDAEVKVTDDDIKAYMQKHKGLFETDQPTRSIEYVSYDIIPSAADTARALDALEQVKAEFATTKDNKTFVNNKSDEANSFSEAFLNKAAFQSKYADTIMSQSVGSIYGPYYENGSYKLTKIVDKQTLPDSSKARLILVRTKEKDTEILSDTMAKQRIDSAVMAIKAGVPFDSVASRYSDDDVSKKTGGEYTFSLLQRGTMPKEVGDFIFTGKKGETKSIKVTNANYSGYLYVDIEDQMAIGPAVQIATIAKNLAPSDSTVNAIYAKANEFAGKNATGPEFDEAIKKQNLNKRVGDNIKAGSFNITGLNASREIIKWMYDHKVGDVSQVFQLGDQRYVVAKLSKIQDKGMMEITPSIRPQLEQRVREEMKADLIAKKYNGKSLDAIAAAANSPVAQSDSVTLGAAYIPGLGYEPKVVGYTFCPSFQPNAVSPGIKGQGGVYFISVVTRTTKPAMDPNMMMQMITQQRRMQEMQTKNAVGQVLEQSVAKQADVQYNTEKF